MFGACVVHASQELQRAGLGESVLSSVSLTLTDLLWVGRETDDTPNSTRPARCSVLLLSPYRHGSLTHSRHVPASGALVSPANQVTEIDGGSTALLATRGIHSYPPPYLLPIPFGCVSPCRILRGMNISHDRGRSNCREGSFNYSHWERGVLTVGGVFRWSLWNGDPESNMAMGGHVVDRIRMSRKDLGIFSGVYADNPS